MIEGIDELIECVKGQPDERWTRNYFYIAGGGGYSCKVGWIGQKLGLTPTYLGFLGHSPDLLIQERFGLTERQLDHMYSLNDSSDTSAEAERRIVSYLRGIKRRAKK